MKAGCCRLAAATRNAVKPPPECTRHRFHMIWDMCSPFWRTASALGWLLLARAPIVHPILEAKESEACARPLARKEPGHSIMLSIFTSICRSQTTVPHMDMISWSHCHAGEHGRCLIRTCVAGYELMPSAMINYDAPCTWQASLYCIWGVSQTATDVAHALARSKLA